jgi:CubicO group peptidase (beta-lactamase class C family)
MKKILVLLLSALVLPSSPADSIPLPPAARTVPASVQETYIDPHPYPWPESSPELQGLDAEIFERAFQSADDLPYMYALVVIRNGRLIAERYFHGQSKFQANHLHSASKSFTSALVGLALRERYLQNLDQKMMDFFPEYDRPDLDPRKRGITLRHLLTMRAGFAWDDNLANFQAYVASPDWIKYVIDLPLRHDPGQVFNYSTVQTNLLAAIIAKSTGLSARAFAERYLFEPLGISIQHWLQDPQGYYTGGHEMYFSPRDMARFGFLYLRSGGIDSRPIIPSSWVEESWQCSGHSGWDWAALRDEGYGYQWWMGTLGGYDIFFAAGKGGQYIIAVPEIDLVIVTATDGESWVGDWQQNQEILRLLDRYVLQAVRNRLGDAPYSPSGLSVQKISNRGLAYREYINLIRWAPNALNAAADIVKYRIYEVVGESRILRGEVQAGTGEFRHRRVDRSRTYHYAVSAIAADGRESIPAFGQNLGLLPGH